MICEKCGSDKNVIHHHEKYLEIHGVEKIVMLCKSCHFKLHQKLRKEGKCNISVIELNKISSRACSKSIIQKEKKKLYDQKPEHKEKIKVRNNSLEYKEYQKNIIRNIDI